VKRGEKEKKNNKKKNNLKQNGKEEGKEGKKNSLVELKPGPRRAVPLHSDRSRMHDF